MKKVAAMTWDEGNGSETFKLADNHSYFLHRIPPRKEGRPTLYSLLSADKGVTASYTPYVTEAQMDRVLELRSSEDRKVDAAPDEISSTGYTCPGCGAVVTKEGAHIGKPPAADVQCDVCGEYDGKHLDWCTPEKRASVHAKDEKRAQRQQSRFIKW